MADLKLSTKALRPLLFVVSLVCLAFAFETPVHAGPQAPDDGCLTDPQCRASYDQAVVLFEGGRFEAALPKFQAAYQRRQMPWLLINIGRTLHRLGRPREALDFYDRYRQAESKPDAETLDRLEKYTAQAKALADSTPATNQPPPTIETPPPPVNPEPPKPTSEEKPVYKKWWFWTAIGGGALAVVVIGVAAGVATRSSSPDPTPPQMFPDGVQRVMFSF